jgi:phosphoserine phosphatase RsbU/P
VKPFDDLEIVRLTVQGAVEKQELTLKNKHLLENLARQNEELARTVSRLSSLIKAGYAMSVMITLPELLDYFVEIVSREIKVERVSLMLLNRETKELHIAASRGIQEEIAHNTRIKLGERIAGHVASTGEPLIVNDVWSHPFIKEIANPLLSDSFVSLPIVLSVPIKLQDTILGVINATNKHSGGIFGKEDLEFLSSLAGQAAVAIENAWRFSQIQTAYESLRESQAQLVVSERLRELPTTSTIFSAVSLVKHKSSSRWRRMA